MFPPAEGLVLLAESSALPDDASTRLLDVVNAAIDAGIRTVIVRDKDRSVAERAEVVAAVVDRLRPLEGTVLLASDDGDADPLGADGLHLSARHESGQTPFATPVVTEQDRLGISVHDSDELARAAALGADYVTVSPVYPTSSKPGYGPALGPAGLAALVTASPVPVVALGGITTPAHVVECLAAGAVGVAVMGAVLRAADPAAAAASLVSAATENSGREGSEADAYPPEYLGGTR